jgi:hypothetical protein
VQNNQKTHFKGTQTEYVFETKMESRITPPRGLSGQALVDLLSGCVPAIVRETQTQVQLDRSTDVSIFEFLHAYSNLQFKS